MVKKIKGASKKCILVMNGSNLNLVGSREPDIYGNQAWEEIKGAIEDLARKEDVNVIFYQSNHEGDLVDYLHKSLDKVDFLILNPGGFTHYSVSLRDAVLATGIPMIEVHLSNIYSRDPFRQKSLFSDIAQGIISGFKGESYKLAFQVCLKLVKKMEI